MTIQALTVSVETSFITVNAEAGPESLPTDIQAFPPLSIEIKDTSSRLNNPLDAIISNQEIQINQGVWNNLNQNVPQFNNKIDIIDGTDTTILAKYPPKSIPVENSTWNTGFIPKNAEISINVGSTTNTLETKITNSKIPIHDSNLDLFEANGNTVNTELFISNTTGISSQGPVENGYETEASDKKPTLDYQSSGDIALNSKISNTKIISKKSSTLSTSSYGMKNATLKIVNNTDTALERTLNSKKILIENPPSDSNASIVTNKNSTGIDIIPTTKSPAEIPISSRYIGIEADKASLSPSFCNAVQLTIMTSNQTPLGYFERDGHGYFETITPENDPRLGTGTSSDNGQNQQQQGGGTSGPIQTWSS